MHQAVEEGSILQPHQPGRIGCNILQSLLADPGLYRRSPHTGIDDPDRYMIPGIKRPGKEETGRTKIEYRFRIRSLPVSGWQVIIYFPYIRDRRNKEVPDLGIIGSGDLWITEYVLTYDGQPSYTVSIMEFRGDKVAHETQYFADPFAAPEWRRQWVQV